MSKCKAVDWANSRCGHEDPLSPKPTDQKPIWESTLSGLMVEQTELWWSYDKCKSGWEKIKVDEKLHDWQIRLKTFIKEVEKAAYERGKAGRGCPNKQCSICYPTMEVLC